MPPMNRSCTNVRLDINGNAGWKKLLAGRVLDYLHYVSANLALVICTNK